MITKKNPLDEERKFLSFPVDTYVSATIISYQTAALPPNKYSKDQTTPVQSCRFLFAGRVINPDTNEPEVVRKWTRWFTISYNEKSSLSRTFQGFTNIKKHLTDNGDGGLLWSTPYKIFLEMSDDEKYSNIVRVKPSDDKSVLDICWTAEVETADGKKSFIPYRKVSAYGNLVDLLLAAIKRPEGILEFDTEHLIENPKD